MQRLWDRSVPGLFGNKEAAGGGKEAGMEEGVLSDAIHMQEKLPPSPGDCLCPRSRPLGPAHPPHQPEKLQDPPRSAANWARRLGGREERGDWLQMDHLVQYSAA